MDREKVLRGLQVSSKVEEVSQSLEGGEGGTEVYESQGGGFSLTVAARVVVYLFGSR